MKQREENLLFSNLKFIPQVTLLTGTKIAFKMIISDFLKKIVCQQQFCSVNSLCSNCQKLQSNCYFDLNWYQFNKNNLMKKQDVVNIIKTLSHQSLEHNNPRICIIEEIEFSSLEASNIFLKFLENLPNKVFLIFTSVNSKKVLPTIKSRCQIINLSNEADIFFDGNNFNLIVNDLEMIEWLVKKFIMYDNNKESNNNFFLIKELLNLKEKIILFFQFLLLLAQEKVISISMKNNVNSASTFENQIVKKLLKNWKNNDQLFLIYLIEILNEVINKFSNTKNINLNLLLNYFFITLYQGQSNECKK